MRCFAAVFTFSLSFLPFNSLNIFADELPTVETLFREAHDNVSRIITLDYESITETPGDNGRIWAIRQAHFQKDEGRFRIDVMDNGPAVRGQRFNRIGLLNNYSVYTVELRITPVHVTPRREPGPEFSHDLWWNTYRWVGDAAARANYAAYLRAYADQVESGTAGQANSRVSSAAPYRRSWNDFENWNTWEQQISHSTVLREETLLGQKAFVVEVSPPKNQSFEVWLIRQPACLPVRMVTRDENQESKIQFNVQDVVKVPSDRGFVVLPARMETSHGVERLIDDTLLVNQEIEKGRLQIETLLYGLPQIPRLPQF